MIKLAVIIPVYNHLEYTRKCLANLLAEEEKCVEKDRSFEIIVVDDGSTDGTEEYIKKLDQGIHLLKGDGSLWWSGSVNKGTVFAMDELNCSHYLWWNNDILAKDDYFKQLFELLSRTDENTIFGSLIFQMNAPEEIWSAGGYFNTKNGKKDLYGRGEKKDRYLQPFEVDWFPGMGTVFPAKVYHTIGLCDEKRFPQYHGDSDYSFRARKHGFRLILHPSLLLYNDTSNTAKKHENSFRQLIRSLHNIKSLYNITLDICFYKKHSKSVQAYFELARKYAVYIGGFFKWKLLGLLGVNRK